MADKAEYVDFISEATQQHRRRAVKHVQAESEQQDERRLSNWPPRRLAQWRLETLTPWKFKLRSWAFKDWD